MIRSRLMALSAACTVAFGAGAMADTHSFTAFNASVGDTVTSVELAGAPANSWRSVTITVDWTAGPGDPYSEEAVFFLTDRAAVAGDLPNQTIYYSFGRLFPNGLPSGDPITLTTTIYLDRPYQGGDPFHMAFFQQFPGSIGNWNNVVVTLDTAGPPAATPPVSAEDLGALCGTADITRTPVALGPTDVKWYKFTLGTALSDAGSYYLDIDTAGVLTPDTYIALYNDAGDLMSFDDDDGNGFTSLMSFGAAAPTRDPGVGYTRGGGATLNPADGRDGGLPAGTYYIALTRYSGTVDVERDFVVTTAATGTVNAQFAIRKNLPACGPVACSPADLVDGLGSPPGDGFVTGTDADFFVMAYNTLLQRGDGSYYADLTDGFGGGPDGFVTGTDADYFTEKYFLGC